MPKRSLNDYSRSHMYRLLKKQKDALELTESDYYRESSGSDSDNNDSDSLLHSNVSSSGLSQEESDSESHVSVSADGIVDGVEHICRDFEDIEEQMFHNERHMDEREYNHEMDENAEIKDFTDVENNSDSEESQESEDETDSNESSDDASSEMSDSDDTDRFFGDPLYEGSRLTLAESIIAILTLVFRHKINNSLLSDILQLLCVFCPNPNRCVGTLYKLRKMIQKFKSPVQRIYFCSKCTKKLDENSTCDKCPGAEKHFFIILPVLEQLKKLYRRPSFVENLKHKTRRQKKNERNYEDIYDGNIYKKLSQPGQFLSNPDNISFTWNTDGVQIFKSSRLNVWPIYLTINELPFHLRKKKENMIIAGLWFGTTKPDPNLFLDPLVPQMKGLFEGVLIKVLGVIKKIRALVICGTCDWPAKALFFNMKYHGGHYACPKCLTKGDKKDGVMSYSTKIETRRTTDQAVENAKRSTEKKPIHGIKGPTMLSLFVYDFIRTTVIDDLHCVYLSITRHFMDIWFSKDHSSETWSLYSMIDVVNDRLKKITPPSFVKRCPRGLSDLAYWKGVELKLWLLVYSIPILTDLLHPNLLDHHKLLVLAIYLLSKESISDTDLTRAKNALNKYVADYVKHYPTIPMTPYFHQLLHLPENVEDYGPLFLTSCFIYEDMNGQIRMLVHGTTHAGLQIMSNAAFFAGFEYFKYQFLIPGRSAYLFCDKILKPNMRRKLTQISESLFIIGALKIQTTLPNLITHVLNSQSITYDQIGLFQKVLKDSVEFNATSYKRRKRTDSSCIKFTYNDLEFSGVIKYFLEVKNENLTNYYALVNIFDDLHEITVSNGEALEFIWPQKPTNRFFLLDLKLDFHICYNIKFGEICYVIESTKILTVE